DRRHLLGGELEVPHVQVLAHALRAGGLGKDDVAPLDRPPNDDLRDGATDLLRQRLQLCVTEDPALRERAPRLDGDPVLGAVVAHLVVDEVRVGLDLVHSGDAQAGLGEAGQVRGVEIGYADRVDRQVRADAFHDLPYAGDVRVHGQRPMHEIQVDPATQRLEGAFGGLPGRGGLVEGVVELGGDPEIVARQAGCGDRAAHALLVAVHLR